MKKFSFASIFTAISLIGAFLIPSCASAPTANVIATIQAVSQEAALVGTTLYLQGHPEARPIFVVAEQSLAAIVSGGTFDAVAFQKAIAGLPVDVLHGETGAIIDSAIVTVYSVVLGFIDIKDSPSWVKPLAVGTLNGLQQALAQTTTANGAPKLTRPYRLCVIPSR